MRIIKIRIIPHTGHKPLMHWYLKCCILWPLHLKAWKNLSGIARMVGLEQPLYEEQLRRFLRLEKRWLGEQNTICKLWVTERKLIGSTSSLFLLMQVWAMKGMKRWHFPNKRRTFLTHLLKLGKSSHGFKKWTYKFVEEKKTQNIDN